MITFNDLLKEQMKNPAFRKEYEAIQPEIDDIRSLIDDKISPTLKRQKKQHKSSGIKRSAMRNNN